MLSPQRARLTPLDASRRLKTVIKLINSCTLGVLLPALLLCSVELIAVENEKTIFHEQIDDEHVVAGMELMEAIPWSSDVIADDIERL